MRNDIASYVACGSGALTLEAYQSLLKDAGLPSNILTSSQFRAHAKPLHHKILPSSRQKATSTFISRMAKMT